MTGTDFPGGVGVTRLDVYPWAATDGHFGGSPHLHLASAEAYVVLAGTGRVQTVTAAGRAEHELHAGLVLWFTPGTVHRIIRTSDDLDVLAIMDNAGLPEHGDAVLTFPRHVLADPQDYARAVALPDDPAQRDEAALRRRDLALAGYEELLQDLDARGAAAVDDLHAAATALVRDRLPQWRVLVESGPAERVRATKAQLDRLAADDRSGLARGRVRRLEPAGQTGRRIHGMCGYLRTWDLQPPTDAQRQG